MPVLDFKEIPQANSSGGPQDSFEQFARDFLEFLGLEIEDDPDRGQHDIIAIEKREGILGTTLLRWLVSCKHKAHSGSAVFDSDEQDLKDRIRTYGASGFLGFYSTFISAPLGRKLQALSGEFDVKAFDHESIERALLIQNSFAQTIARRYFPHSYGQWEMEHHELAILF